MNSVLAPLVAAILLLTAFPAAAQREAPEAPLAEGQGQIGPGEYRDGSSFELFHGLRLNADGTYQWALSVGALDRRSAGTWAQQDGVITLTTAPTPVAPNFQRDPDDGSPEAPFLIVRWPNGKGIAGIDFVLTCADSEPVSGYTQSDGWEPETEPEPGRGQGAGPGPGPGVCNTPVAIELTEPIHDIGPAQFDISGSTGGLQFTLVPNDFGMTDLTGTEITASGPDITFQVLGYQVTMKPILPD